MAWTAPRTWTTAELVTAAMMNTHVRDNDLYLKGLFATATGHDHHGGTDDGGYILTTRTILVQAPWAHNDTAGTGAGASAQGWNLPNDKDCIVIGWMSLPADYSSGLTAHASIEGSAGNVAYQMDVSLGSIGEAFNTHTGTSGSTLVTIGGGVLSGTASIAVAAADGADHVALVFQRFGTSIGDTSEGTLFFKGFVVSYTATS